MERLTGRAQNTYPVERTIMEAEAKPQSRERRIADLVRRHTERKDKPNPENENARPQAGGRQRSLAEKYKHNKELQKLAEELDDAINRKGASTTGYLEKLFELVGRGKVSENQAYQFTQDVNPRISERNFSDINNGDRELAQDVEAIVAQRKAKGLSAEEAHASRAAMEAAFGRKLTEAELDRALKGREGSRSKVSSEFELQIQTIERIIDNPKRLDSFEESLSKSSPEAIKKALSGQPGRLVLGVLLGDVADREHIYQRFEELMTKDSRGIVQGMKGLVEEIRQQERKESVYSNPEKAGQQIDEFREEVAKEKSKYLSQEALESIGGGADEQFSYDTLMEKIDSLPNENNEIFKSEAASAVGNDFIDHLITQTYEDIEVRKALRQRFNELLKIENPAELKARLKASLQELMSSFRKFENDPERVRERVQDQKDAEELTATKEKTKGGKTFNIRGIEEIAAAISPPRPGERPFFEREPKNVKEVAVWIMAGDDRSVWGPEGLHPIFKWGQGIDPETGQREAIFQPQNLILWIRNKSLEHHGDNPNDPLNLLQGISIETMFKSISILQMKYQKQKYFQDESGRPLSNLADEVINEAWLFGVRRNKNLGYMQAFNSDEKLFEAIVEMSGKNDHTGGRNLANHFMMGEEFSDEEGNKDNRVGDAMLAANLIYRNLADIKKLRETAPADSAIFTLEGFKKAARVLNDQDFGDAPKNYGNLFFEGNRVYFRDPRTKVITEIFNSKGELVSDSNLVKFLNFFPDATPQDSQETFVRELVKQSVADMIGFDSGTEREMYQKFLEDQRKSLGPSYNIGISDYRKIVRMNLDWAETNSWVEQRWNGAAARNDTGYRGYDAWTKMYIQYYRERQSGARTAGPIGNPHDMQIFRMLMPDMWLAIRTEGGESVQEVFEELHEYNRKLYSLKGELTEEQKKEKDELENKKNEAYSKLRFPRWTESDWASNGVNRQAQVWHNIMNTEDIAFNEIVKRDNWGILKFDRAKFEEVVKDDFIKKRRYAFSSNNAMNYGAMTRMRYRTAVEFNKDGTVKEGSEKYDFKDVPLAEAMFGDVVIRSIREEWYAGKLEYEGADRQGNKVIKRARKQNEEFDLDKHGTYLEFLNSQKARDKILKNVCRAGLAAQIKAHRQWTGLDERWDAHSVRKFYQALRSMPQYIEDPLTGKEIKIDAAQFFSKEDIKWIRDYSGTSNIRLLRDEIGLTFFDIIGKAFPGAFKEFFDDIFE